MDKPRYDGQVRKVGELTQENTTLKAEIARLSGTQQAPAPTAQPGQPTTDEMVAVLYQDFESRAVNTLLEQVLAEYPEARPFSEFIGGSTADEVRQSAKSLHERALALKGGQPDPGTPPPEGGGTGSPPAAPSGAQPPAPGTTTTVVPGGAPPAPGGGEASPEEQIREALRTRNMAEYTRLKRQFPDVSVRQRLVGDTNYRQQ